MRKVQYKHNFKNILANPFEFKCPASLPENELQTLKNILLNRSGGIKLDECLSNQKIQLGLESALRAINNGQASCLFLSLSIKPAFIINLITRNANAKDATTLIYAQTNLEEVTQQIFGIKAVAMTFPKNLKAINEGLFFWMQEKINSELNTHSDNLTKPCSEDDKSLQERKNDDTSATDSSAINGGSKTLDFRCSNMASENKIESNEMWQLPKYQKNINSCEKKNNKSKIKSSPPKYQSLIVKKIKSNPKRRKLNKY